MKAKEHIVKEIKRGSIAQEMEIEAGDKLLSINNTPIEDIFDYQYLVQDEYIEVLIQKPDGEEWLLEIDKEYDEDLGITFENGLMDEYRSCHNKCIFCFIDQMPEGMRDTLYFKDDDSRLSFLQGNYVTLTNMSEHDIDRIIQYHLSPINISFQTTNPELRCKMLNNRFAGEALKKVDKLYEAGIEMNGQIVLCKDVNDKEELERSIRDLTKYLPFLRSVSVVPVGLSKYREGLFPLEPFSKEDAREVIELIHSWQDKLYEQWGLHFIHASDEWYLLAGYPFPKEERYDGYLQLENGVGMMRLLWDEFEEELHGILSNPAKQYVKKLQQLQDSSQWGYTREISIATGRLAFPQIKSMAWQLMEHFPKLNVHIYEIRNDFFGEMITVSGLLTGQDLMKQLQGENLGECLYLPQNILRSGEDVFLDDLHVGELEKALQVKIDIVKSSGCDFVHSILGLED